MAPPSADEPASLQNEDSSETFQTTINSKVSRPSAKTYPAPLVYSDSLDEHESFDLTTVIGREFPTVQLTEILKNDAKVRDLAITGTIPQFQIIVRFVLIPLVSQRGVVFFRNQDINIEEQKRLAQKLGELTGKPESSKVREWNDSNS